MVKDNKDFRKARPYEKNLWISGICLVSARFSSVPFFCLSKRKEPKKKTASDFQRPTNGSIPKPGKPFVPAGREYDCKESAGTHFSAWLFTESSPSGCPAENPKAKYQILSGPAS
jgi:hypothetical protein